MAKKVEVSLQYHIKHKMKDGRILDSVKGYRPIIDNISPEAARLIVQIITGKTYKD